MSGDCTDKSHTAISNRVTQLIAEFRSILHCVRDLLDMDSVRFNGGRSIPDHRFDRLSLSIVSPFPEKVIIRKARPLVAVRRWWAPRVPQIDRTERCYANCIGLKQLFESSVVIYHHKREPYYVLASTAQAHTNYGP